VSTPYDADGLPEAEHLRLVGVVAAAAQHGPESLLRLWDDLVALHGVEATSRIWQEALSSGDASQT
jgi:hypothetical protein